MEVGRTNCVYIAEGNNNNSPSTTASVGTDFCCCGDPGSSHFHSPASVPWPGLRVLHCCYCSATNRCYQFIAVTFDSGRWQEKICIIVTRRCPEIWLGAGKLTGRWVSNNRDAVA